MRTIVRFAVRPDGFDLGRMLRVPDGMTLDLETYIPSGELSELFFSISTDSAKDRTAFIDRIEKHPSIRTLETIEAFERRTLLAMGWDVSADTLFRNVRESSGQILRVTGTSDEWEFVVRFRTHDGIRTFADR